MEVRDGESFHYQQLAGLAHLQRQNTTAHLTYEDEYVHPTFGLVTRKIFRAVGNDSRCKIEMTVALLKKYEPKVGMWAGDRFEYWKGDNLIGVDQN